jgi:hypothetical protein
MQVRCSIKEMSRRQRRNAATTLKMIPQLWSENISRAVAYTPRALDRSPGRPVPAHLCISFASPVLQSFISLQQCTTRGCHPFWMSSDRALDESSPNGLRQLIDEAHRQQDQHQGTVPAQCPRTANDANHLTFPLCDHGQDSCGLQAKVP